ncbi:hypothetical protein TrVE_jg6780 [Triparma verrucosa]|nr:hypothetical protein TrVE_jg6780 [Triparma verrucosa]
MSASSTRCFSIAPDSIVKFSYDVGAKASEELLCPVGSASAVYPYALETGGYFPSLFESLPPAGESVTVKDVQLAPSNPDMIANIPFDALSQSGLNLDELKIGQELFLQNGMKAAIVEKSDASIKIDANPPLSRLKDLTMEVSTEQILERTSPFEKTGTLSSWTTATWSDPKYETATFAGGCFWGVELAFQRQEGVIATKVGYTQGKGHSPSYEAVCSGTTGHTEGIQVVFDNSVVSYEDLCNLLVERLGDNVFKKNQVGNDMGTQYRSGIYPHNEEQKKTALEVIEAIGGDVKTEVVDATDFFDGEPYHQQYLMKGGQSAKKDSKETIRCYG